MLTAKKLKGPEGSTAGMPSSFLSRDRAFFSLSILCALFDVGNYPTLEQLLLQLTILLGCTPSPEYVSTCFLWSFSFSTDSTCQRQNSRI